MHFSPNYNLRWFFYLYLSKPCRPWCNDVLMAFHIGHTGIVSSKIYDKRDDFNFEIVNFSFLDGDVPRSLSYGVHISQLIRFARVCSNVEDFKNRNLFLTAKLLNQGYRYHKIRKAFSKF